MTQEAQVRQYLTRLRDEFPFFLAETWVTVGLPHPSRIQMDMAEWMQSGPKNRGILGFRGLSKTWITLAYIAWRLFRNPNERILLCSATMGHSRNSLRLIRRWLEKVVYLNHLLPNHEKGHRDSAEQFDVGPSKDDRIASVTAIGITGQLPGLRASIILADDVETPENTITHDTRARNLTRCEEFENIALPGADILYLGTPHHEESLYKELIERGYSFRTYPVEYPSADTPVPCLAPLLADDLAKGTAKPGQPVWPERFGREFILGKKIRGKSSFAMQFQIRWDLSDSEKYPLRLSDMIVMPVHRDKAPISIAWGQRTNAGSTAVDIPSVGLGSDRFYAPVMTDDTWREFFSTKAALDPAGAGSDEMAWAIAAQLHGYIFVKHSAAVTGGATQQNLEQIVLSLRDHNAKELYVETNFGGDMLIRLLEPVMLRFSLKPEEHPAFPLGWSCAIFGVHSTGQKEVRIIDALEPVLNQHRLIVDPSVANDSTLMRQLTRITRDRGCLEHDDRIEALSAVVFQHRDALNQDASKMAKSYSERLQAERLKHLQSRFAPRVRETWMVY